MGDTMTVGPSSLGLLCGLLACWLARPGQAGGAALAASSGVSPYKVPSGPQAYCDPCDVRSCPQILPETCGGTLVKDDCGCCPRCDLTQRPANQTAPLQSNHTCADLNCRGSQVCVLNIQNIPICRCPSIYWCRRQDRREVCGRDGKTYRSKCYLKVSECAQNKKIRVAHKGPCATNGDSKKAKKKQREAQQQARREAQQEARREAQARREGQARRNRRRKKGKRLKGDRGREERRPKRDHRVGSGTAHTKKYRFYHQKAR